MEPKLIAVRLEPKQLLKLDAIVKITRWNQSEVIRQLIDNASVTPPAVETRLSTKREKLLSELSRHKTATADG